MWLKLSRSSHRYGALLDGSGAEIAGKLDNLDRRRQDDATQAKDG